MALVSSTIPNLINGVSQQPAALRLASQAEAVVNCMPSPVEGLKKRPAFNYIKRLFTGTAGTGRPFFTVVDRDGANRWGILLQDQALKVFDLDGNLKTVATPNGLSYLDVTGDPSKQLRVASVADYTFIVNREKTVAMLTDAGNKSPTWGTKSMVFVKAANYNTTYTVTVDSTTVSYTTPAVGGGQPTTPAIATSLADQLVASNINPVATTLTTSTTGTTTTATFTSTTGVVVGQYIKDAAGHIPLRAKVTAVTATQVTFAPAAAANINNINQITFRTAAFDVTASDYIINIIKNDNTDYTLKATDGYDGLSIRPIKGTVSSVSDLPTIATHGFIVKVQGNTATEFDDWYLKFVTTAGSGFGPGSWQETVAPGIDYKLDPATMPHVLVRENDGTYTFKQFDWSPRMAGDPTSASGPSFVGTTINNITVFRNRLVLLSDENVIMSAADEFDRFFPETVQTILDSDPIDLTAGGNQINILLAAVPFASTLLLFSKHNQFRLDSGSLTVQPLTPKSANITAMTAFELYDGVDPVPAGRTIFFPIPRGDYSGLREYFLPDTTSPVPASDEVTSAVPRFISKTVVQLTASVSEEMVAVVTKEEPTKVFLYKFFFQGDQKLQSAWSYWEASGSKSVLGLQFIDSDLYTIVEYADGVYLERAICRPENVDSGATFELLLDRKASEASCTVALTNPAGLDVQSTITLPYPRNTGAQMVVVGRAYAGNTLQPGQVIYPISQGSDTITVRGNLTAAKFYVGELYSMRYEFSTPYLKEQPQGGGIAVIGGPRLQMRTWTLIHDKSGHFKVRVTPRGRTAREHPYNGITVGDPGVQLGQVPQMVGKFRVPVMAQNIDTKVEILSDSPLPCRIQSAEWEGMYFSRSDRL
jgi:hypothetical protein